MDITDPPILLSQTACTFVPCTQDMCSKCWVVRWAKWWGSSDGTVDEVHLRVSTQASGGRAGALWGGPYPPSL